MAVQVHGFGDLLVWANSKSCEPWKNSRSCSHEGCVQAQRAVDVLSAAVEGPPGVWTVDDSSVAFTA